MEINFVNALSNTNTNTNSNKKKEKKPNSLIELSNNGWTILNKDKRTKKTTIIRPYNEEYLKEKIEKKEIKLILNKMITNWNNFREKDIELNGDLSLYFNYKEEIEKMIIEDRSIEEMFSNENSSDHSDNEYSDDEYYKYLGF